ncbi:MAG: tRNA (Guanine37-N1) -methyltransferase [Candidatus Carbobacillus altaicus]|uniref:tRNA (guanine-N(1)-)-methyltransferase n=1 Tax=Candidatus Carbonibacillus altaicus TaxID=2163959 RepID=A0A2R6XYX0_9BACL|nr:MAG: tRNA (Guanine37-N1) -methyltransferase [Candidatus Carbobacillus altaicus]PTQ55609.1 MAG: tRNA (Guanine37-N1) -methyltransferase [Candidatus Carbobacillus altaicus]
MWKATILTLFPEWFPPILDASILGRARKKGLWGYRLINFRDFTDDRHQRVDDEPYGGGDGMVLKVQPIDAALASLFPHPDAFSEWLMRPKNVRKPRVILTTPQGEVFHQRMAERWAREEELVFLCGHYEGFDERVRELYVTDEVSLGDFVLTGGELATMVMIDTTVRLIPGVLGGEGSVADDSFANDRLEYPHYTRPVEFRGLKVPDVLLSGHHERIRLWRKEQALLRTLRRRPDLLDKSPPDAEEKNFLRAWKEREKHHSTD